MSPVLQKALEAKDERRKRLAALPYPEKVKIVEQMRDAAREIRRVATLSGLRER